MYCDTLYSVAMIGARILDPNEIHFLNCHQGANSVVEAVGIHMRSLIVRLRVVNSELRHAERKLDELCTAIGEISGKGRH